jgi:hypothetical protein
LSLLKVFFITLLENKKNYGIIFYYITDLKKLIGIKMKRKIEIESLKLEAFLKSSKAHIRFIDLIMTEPDSRIRGKKIAQEMNRFNFDLDVFLHFECKVPLEKLGSILKKGFKV